MLPIGRTSSSETASRIALPHGTLRWLEGLFGGPLSWEPLDNLTSCRIRYAHPQGGEVTITDHRDELIDWFVTSALRPRSSTQAIRALIDEE